MDAVWIGRRLMGASTALSERFLEPSTKAGPGAPVIEVVCSRLLSEIGRSLVLQESDPQQPLLRTRGQLRLPTNVDEAALARAYNVLATIVSHYIAALPGATPSLERFARDAIRHAARVTLLLRRDLLAGKRRPETERLFGGVALIAYPSRPLTIGEALSQ